MIYRCTLAAAVSAWSNLTAANIGQRDMTASAETARRHALERQKSDLAAVQILENKLNIAQRWEQGSFEWQAAAEKVSVTISSIFAIFCFCYLLSWTFLIFWNLDYSCYLL